MSLLCTALATVALHSAACPVTLDDVYAQAGVSENCRYLSQCTALDDGKIRLTMRRMLIDRGVSAFCVNDETLCTAADRAINTDFANQILNLKGPDQ